MSKEMTTEEFILKARAIHGNTYDYSQIQYVNQNTRVPIICPEHGTFTITPNGHLRGDKCPQCECLEIEAQKIIETISLPLPTSFVSIDFEHLYSQHVSACSVGMVKYIDGKISKHYYSRIKPPKDYEGKKGKILSDIHGFTSEEQFENERTMVDILPEIEHFAEGLPLVAHNATTEKYCIKDTAEFYGLTTILDYDHIYDTVQISKVVEIMDGCIIRSIGHFLG